MHVTAKDDLKNGIHAITLNIEADGAAEVASSKADIESAIISAERTASGGIEVKVAVSVTEPAPQPKLTPEQTATAYLASKGVKDIKGTLDKFGVDRILERKRAEELAADEKLNQELDNILPS